MITAEELEKLAQLKDKGIITEEEFNAKREEFLRQSSNEISNKKKDDEENDDTSSGSNTGGWIVGVLAIVGLLSYCSGGGKGDVFYDKNGDQWFTIDSEVGKNCFNEVYKKAKWGVKVESIYAHDFLTNISLKIEKNENCKMNNYSMYVGTDSLLVYNGFGAAHRTNIVCFKNKNTNKYSAVFLDDTRLLDNLATQSSGNMCERHEAVAHTIESGIFD